MFSTCAFKKVRNLPSGLGWEGGTLAVQGKPPHTHTIQSDKHKPSLQRCTHLSAMRSWISSRDVALQIWPFVKKMETMALHQDTSRSISQRVQLQTVTASSATSYHHRRHRSLHRNTQHTTPVRLHTVARPDCARTTPQPASTPRRPSRQR